MSAAEVRGARKTAALFERLISWIDEKPAIRSLPSAGPIRRTIRIRSGRVCSRLISSPADASALFARPVRLSTRLRETDRQLAPVFACLRERGLADDTLVIITGDHGEAFADLHQQRGHAWSVYEEEMRVPLWSGTRGSFPKEGALPRLAGTIDLNPTIADLLDFEPDPGWQGHSLSIRRSRTAPILMAIAGGDVFGVRGSGMEIHLRCDQRTRVAFQPGTRSSEQHDLAHE